MSELTKDQQKAYKSLLAGKNIFLTGNAGTGKSFVLNKFIDHLKETETNFIAIAPTGIAALNLVDGSTIHRTLQLPIGVINPEESCSMTRKVVNKASVIIIDEISMCRIDLFECIMAMIRNAEKQDHKQVVLVGDFFQLPPVVTQDDREVLMRLYPGSSNFWCFESAYWSGFDFECHLLKQVIRQSEPEFIDALNKARYGEEECIEYFNQRAISSRKYVHDDCIWLCARNELANNINDEKLEALEHQKFIFKAHSEGKVGKGDKLVDETLKLCVGARVMSVLNNPDDGYVNGSQGTVTSVSKENVLVHFDNGADALIEPHEWEIKKSKVVTSFDKDGKEISRIGSETIGTYKQIPLKLAYAITIHKSQGQTFDKCCVDSKVFDRGQLYVGLSRCANFAGLTICPKIEAKRLIVDSNVVGFYKAIEDGSYRDYLRCFNPKGISYITHEFDTDNSASSNKTTIEIPIKYLDAVTSFLKILEEIN